MNEPLTSEQIAVLAADDNPEIREQLNQYLRYKYLHFCPRPDNPTEFDEQHSFVFDQFDGLAIARGGNGSGKTELAAYKLTRFLFNNDAPSDLCVFFVASETLEQAGILWRDKLRYYFKPEHVQNIVWHSSKTELPKDVVLNPSKNGNRWIIAFRSYNMGVSALKGFSKVGGFFCDEQVADQQIINELWTRCREFDYVGNRFLTFTPEFPTPWLEDIEADIANHPSYKVYRLNARKCYEAGQIKKIDWLDNTPEELRLTREIGNYVTLSGAVFKEFNPAVHVVEPYKLPDNCTYYRGIDFGASEGHDTVAVYAAREPSGRWIIYHEWGSPGKAGALIVDKVAAIKATAYWNQDAPNYHTYADSEDRQQRLEMSALGINSMIARKEPVLASIAICATQLRVQADGLPNILIFNTCKNLIRQIRGYRWQETSKRSMNPVKPKQEPCKFDDDYLDAWRYIFFSAMHNQIRPWDAVKTVPMKNLIQWR